MIVDRFPVSSGQRGILFVQELSGSAHVYHDWEIFRLVGALDLDALRGAVARLTERHSVLRSRFVTVRDEPAQVVDGRWAGQLRVHRVSADAGAATGIQEFLHRVTRSPFDVEQGPLFKVDVLVVSDDEHLVAFTAHHLVTDGWSTKLMLQEISQSYGDLRAGRPIRAAGPAPQYRDFVLWQRETLRGAELDALLAYWVDHVAGAPTQLRLCPPGPDGSRRRHTESIEFTLSDTVVADLHRFARSRRATLFMALLAVFEVVLCHATRSEDLLVGVPVAGRTSIEFAETLGLFVNLLALRADLRDDPTADELTRRVRAAVLGGFAHQDLPFETLVSTLNPVRSPGAHPLVQATIQLVDDSFDTALRIDGIETSAVAVGQQDIARALVLDLTGHSGGLRGRLAFDPALAGRRLAEAIVASYGQVASALPHRPGDRVSTLTAGLGPVPVGSPPT